MPRPLNPLPEDAEDSKRYLRERNDDIARTAGERAPGGPAMGFTFGPALSDAYLVMRARADGSADERARILRVLCEFKKQVYGSGVPAVRAAIEMIERLADVAPRVKLRPLPLVEDRTDAQLAADGDTRLTPREKSEKSIMEDDA
jgi:hypothetical protein